MSPKITLSISVDLSKKMEQWRDKFNFSNVFQEAISREIEKKENFAKKIKEEPGMAEIIERLRQEKMSEGRKFYEIGKRDGLEWAKKASYQELKYIIEEYKTMFEFTENVISYDPKSSEILGDYLTDIFEEYKDQGMGYTTKKHSNSIPNEIFRLWEKGWKEAVEGFWGEIKDKI